MHESRVAIRRESRTFYTVVAKRIFDIALAVALLPVLLPVISVLWAMTARDGGPGFFGHRRIGRNGKVFRCWKIRTMVPDAEARLAEHLMSNPEAAAEWARDHKLQNDPRITKMGGFLRSTSLDELPQIWNVLRGEMSFVGPRPVVRSEMKKYGHARTAYLSLKPGITGLWQVSGRNDVSYEERVAMDLQYLQTVSFLTDLRLIALTGMSVLDRTGR
ncbi:sugar transferase [Salipiger mucosus]|uniref:sugar transferase n=1 Tax=Salipiger mucosus TaxID=263378 RepID=UPI001FDFA03E|nr:sugar transferase [Salipiger mucosus]